MDKKINPNSEEEYKFQASEQPGSASHFSNVSAAGETASAIMEKTKRQHIFLVLIIIFACLGIYKVTNKLLHRVSTEPSVVEKRQKPAVPIVSAAEQANINIANRFKHLERAQGDLQTNFQALDSEVSDIKSTLSDLDSRLVQISEQIQSLDAQQEAFLQKQKESASKLTERKKTEPKPIYYVRAMIPGRVWLTMQDGSTLTLGIGDKLSGYGTITAIDSNQGIVTLSSGAVIGFNPDDR